MTRGRGTRAIWAGPGLLAIGMAACVTNSSPQLNEACSETTPCAQGLVCGYPVSAGCVNAGTCVPVVASSADCTQPTVACGCFGGTVEYGCSFYIGYAPHSVAPGVSLSTCSGAGDGGPGADASPTANGSPTADGGLDVDAGP